MKRPDAQRPRHSWPALLGGVLVTCLLSMPDRAWADEVIIVDGETQVAVQAALDALQGPGTVVVPPGRYQVEGTIWIRRNDVTLLGSGSDLTVFYRETDGTNTSMVRSRGFEGVRVSGIRFEGAPWPDSNGREVGVLLENAANFRVDHSSFTHTGFAGVRTNGASFGVVDHCTFEDQFKPGVNTDGYGVVVYGIDALEGVPFGTDRATFIEDSFFRLCRHAVASNKGARYVFRYNSVTENVVAHAIDSHGTEYGSLVGTEWIDAHDNWIDAPIYAGYAVRIRGGLGLVWNNSFVGYNQGIELTQNTSQPTGPVYIWGNTISPETSPMVRARGTQGIPTYSLSPPPDYVPYPYPHPLAAVP